ncbi:MAG TPA: hypothetical protein VIG33_06495 [Pseudobdellovibrionaceae bacterium]
MLRIVQIFGLVFFISHFTIASVEDPQFLLPKVDAFLAKPSFASAFKAGDKIKYVTSDCIGERPCGSGVSMTAVIDPISSDEICINQFGPDNSLKAKDKVNLQQWDNINRNYLRAKINKIESFGFKVSVTRFENITCPQEVYLGPESQCAKVSLQGVNGLNNTSEYQYILWNSPIGIAQIISSTQTDHMLFTRTISYRVTEVYR